MTENLWVQYRNGLRGSVVVVGPDLFVVAWDCGPVNTYGPEDAEGFTPVPLAAGSEVRGSA